MRSSKSTALLAWLPLQSLLALNLFGQADCAEFPSFVSSIELYLNETVGATLLKDTLKRTTLSLYRLKSESLVADMESEISNHIDEYMRIVNGLKNAMETDTANGELLATRDCCAQLDEQQLSNTERQVCLQRNKETSVKEPFMDNFLRSVTAGAKTANVQRYVDSNGLLMRYPVVSGSHFCKIEDYTKLPWFSSAKISRRKRLVFLLGEELLASHRIESLNATRSLLDTVAATDKFNVFVFSSSAHSVVGVWDPIQCGNTQVVPGTYENKNSVLDWLNSTKWAGSQQSDYVMAFDAAFDSINESTTDEPSMNIILFATSAPPLSDFERLFERFNRYKALSVVAHTYGILNPNADILHAIAKQDGTSFSAVRNNEAIEGQYASVGDIAKFSDELASYFNQIPWTATDFTYWGWPHYEMEDWNMTITVSKSVIRAGAFRGVVSADFNVDKLFRTAISQLHFKEAVIGFVVDREGFVVTDTILTPISQYHPESPRIHIRNLHMSVGLEDLISSTGENGTSKAVVQLAREVQTASRGGQNVLKDFEVSCKQSKFGIYIVCAGVQTPLSLSHNMNLPKPNAFTFHYHRLDLTDVEHPCLHGSKTAFIGSTIQMTSDAFLQTSRHLHDEENKETILQYESDIMNAEGRIFGHRARNDIYLTSVLENDQPEIDAFLPKSDIGKLTLWRYIATQNGVFRIWPGTQLPPKYDARQSSWYRSALKYKEAKFTVSTPYMDVITKHWIVTFAKVIYYPSNSTEKEVFGVVGFDIYIWKMKEYLASLNKECEEFCALANPEGFMIYHIAMLKDNEDLKSHVSQFEPELTEYLLNSGLMRKSACRGFGKRDHYHIEYYSFSIDSLSQRTSVPDNVGYLKDINVIFIVDRPFPESGRCHIFEDGKCREHVKCQSPCLKKMVKSCQYEHFTLGNWTNPCGTNLWMTYEETPVVPDGLEKCYEHFEEPDLGSQEFPWMWLIEIPAGLAIFGSAFVWKFFFAKQVDQSQASNTAGAQTFTDGMAAPNTQILNFGTESSMNGPTNFPGPLNSPVDQWGNSVTQNPPPYSFNQQQDFTQSAPPSYGASFQYAGSR